MDDPKFAGARVVQQRMREAGLLPEERSDAVVITGGEGGYVVRDFLVRNRIPFTYRPGTGPTTVAIDGREVQRPTLLQLAQLVGCHTEPDRTSYDLVIVGAGPAGLAAAVYGAAEGMHVLAVEELAPGGQAGTTSRIENYPGFPERL